MGAHTAELMHAGERTDGDVILDRHVAAKRGPVAEDRVVADRAVVGDMGVRHEEIMIADPGHASAARRTPMNGHELAKDVVRPDDQPAPLTAKFQILRDEANGGARKDHGLVADLGPPVHDGGGADPAAPPDPDVLTHDRVRPDDGPGAELGTGRHESGRIDLGLGLRQPEPQRRFGDQLVVDEGA